MLADLNLAELPDDVLVILREAINREIKRRLRIQDIRQRIQARDSNIARKKGGSQRRPAKVPAAFPYEIARGTYEDRLMYLAHLLRQDWSSLFSRSDANTSDYYVYAHIDPRTSHVRLKSLKLILKGKPFYIGKGSGRRAWDLTRNQAHGKRIQVLRQAGYPDGALVQVIRDNLTEQQALELEAKLIYFFGSIYDETTEGCLVNLIDHIRPKFEEEMKVWPLICKEVLPLLKQQEEFLTTLGRQK